MPNQSGMDTMEKSKRGPKFEKDDVIRHLPTGHAFLIIHVYRPICILVVDLEDHSSAPVPHVILPRQYDEYAKDEDTEYSDHKGTWSSAPALTL
jgi:hypothetical protein